MRSKPKTPNKPTVKSAIKPDGTFGEWPMVEPMPDDEAAAVNVALGTDGGPTSNLDGTADDLTPTTLLGDHRPGG